MKFNIIVATSKNDGIGYNNKLPWNTIKNDMKLFSNLTKGKGNNAVIMGKNTYLSIGKSLPNRTNIVISKTLPSYHLDMNDLIIQNSIQETINYCIEEKFEEVWIIGGAKIYEQFINLNIINRIYQTKIYKNYDCDTFFPNIPINYNIESLKKICNVTPCILIVWINKNNKNIYL